MKPETHKKITEIALNICKEELPASLQNIKNGKEVINGTSDEDTKDLIKRATNWHFYRCKNSPIPKIVRSFFKPTSEDILQQRIKTFLSCNKNCPRHFNSLGRILHHIQDMCTPSHVIPIYHGPKFPVYFCGGTIEDSFENFLNAHRETIEADHSILNGISLDSINSFEDLYHSAAQDMLNLLAKAPSPHEGIPPYALFWKNCREKQFEKIKGFGVYGEHHKDFDREEFSNNTENSQYEILLKIQRKITDQAIKHTCRALIFARKNNSI